MPARTSESVFGELRSRIGEGAPERRIDATKLALNEVGDPHNHLPFIHVTGTNGKTSTSRIAESVLRAGGYRTGLFTSPHLVDFRERLMINGEPIEESELRKTWDTVSSGIDRADRKLRKLGRPSLTFFEALTVLAFTAFSRARVDCAVIEVGMGGRWDSTNVADGRVAVVTPIALDHTALLGGTVEEIAATKAGIIKNGAQVVSAHQTPGAWREISRASSARGAFLASLGQEFSVRSTRVRGGQVLSVTGLTNTYESLYLPLEGLHQAENAAVAIAAVEKFVSPHTVTEEIVARGLRGARSPGRLERICNSPEIVVDIAHNPAGAEALADTLSLQYRREQLGVVLAVLDDKDSDGIGDALSRVTQTFFATNSTSERALPARKLAEQLRLRQPLAAVSQWDSASSAIAAAIRWASDPGRSVLVTGSATLVGEVIASMPANALLGESESHANGH